MEGTQKKSCKQQNKVNTSQVVSRYNKPKNSYTIEVFSYDYVYTKEDESIIEYIASQPRDKILVHIDGAVCTRKILECLINDTSHVDDDVLSVYIHLMRAEEHLLYRDDRKVFLENTIISRILKRDGQLDVDLISHDNDIIDERVVNYLDHDMVFFPINIKNLHWYLAVVNAQKCEIHVLDLLGDGVMKRIDLAETIKSSEAAKGKSQVKKNTRIQIKRLKGKGRKKAKNAKPTKKKADAMVE